MEALDLIQDEQIAIGVSEAVRISCRVMRAAHSSEREDHWTATALDIEPLQQWSGLMDAKRRHDFLQMSTEFEAQAERFASAGANASGRTAAQVEADLGAKPVGSVRHSLPLRRVSSSSAQSVAVFEPLLDLHEASAILGMHWKTLEAKARRHEVPAFKLGKRWRFRLSSLNSWLEHGINSNTTDHATVTRQERCF